MCATLRCSLKNSAANLFKAKVHEFVGDGVISFTHHLPTKALLGDLSWIKRLHLGVIKQKPARKNRHIRMEVTVVKISTNGFKIKLMCYKSEYFRVLVIIYRSLQKRDSNGSQSKDPGPKTGLPHTPTVSMNSSDNSQLLLLPEQALSFRGLLNGKAMCSRIEWVVLRTIYQVFLAPC